MSTTWICSHCGAPAYFDGRGGDGPVLLCKCDEGPWINDGRGGYHANPTGAKPIQGKPGKPYGKNPTKKRR